MKVSNVLDHWDVAAVPAWRSDSSQRAKQNRSDSQTEGLHVVTLTRPRHVRNGSQNGRWRYCQ